MIAKTKERQLKFRVSDSPGILGQIASVLGGQNVNIVNVKLEHDVINAELEIFLLVQLPGKIDRNELTQNLAECKGVLQVEWINP